MTRPAYLLLSTSIPKHFVEAHGVDVISHDFPVKEIPQETGVCDVVSCFEAQLKSGKFAGVIASTECDQMRRAADVWRQEGYAVFSFNVPIGMNLVMAEKIYRSELDRLHQWLPAIPEAELNHPLSKDLPIEIKNPKRSLAVLGSPLLFNVEKIAEWLHERGFELVVNWTENCNTFYEKNPPSNVLDTVGWSRAYANLHASPFRKPNTEYFNALNATLKKMPVAGLIYVRSNWCDQMRGVCVRLREVCHTPVFEWIMDPTEDLNNHSRLMTRFEAFLERLEQEEAD